MEGEEREAKVIEGRESVWRALRIREWCCSVALRYCAS